MKKESMVSGANEEMRFIEVSKMKVIDGVPREFTFVFYPTNKGRVFYYLARQKRTIELKAFKMNSPRTLRRRPNMISYYKIIGVGRVINSKLHTFHFMLHRLVAQAFPDICGELKEGYQVDHINGVCDDNRAENLRCITAYENMHSAEQRKKYGAAMKAAWRDPVKRARLQEGARKRAIYSRKSKVESRKPA